MSDLQIAGTGKRRWQIIKRETITDGSVFQYRGGQGVLEQGRKRQKRGVSEHLWSSTVTGLYGFWNGTCVWTSDGIAAISLSTPEQAVYRGAAV